MPRRLTLPDQLVPVAGYAARKVESCTTRRAKSIILSTWFEIDFRYTWSLSKFAMGSLAWFDTNFSPVSHTLWPSPHL
jgi:hypothetical protein